MCADGSSATTEELFQHVGDVSKGTVLTAPIFIGVRSEPATAIKTCLQTGANIDLSVCSNIRAIDKTQITLLEPAVHRHDTCVPRALVEGVATTPRISQWPTHVYTYHLLYEAASELIDVVLPDLKQFTRCNKKDLEALER